MAVWDFLVGVRTLSLSEGDRCIDWQPATRQLTCIVESYVLMVNEITWKPKMFPLPSSVTDPSQGLSRPFIEESKFSHVPDQWGVVRPEMKPLRSGQK